MFSWEVSRKWGQGNLLQQYPLVVMLPLRDPDVQNASKLEDLFPHGHKPFQQEVTVAVQQKAGKGVLLLLDGFDELPEDKRKGSSLLMNVITGKLLPLARVMVTSRPWALKTLLKPHGTCIFHHIEIVGFSKDNISEYITKAFPEATEERKFREYLRTYPHIGSTMYIPLNCAIVVEMYRSSGSTNPVPKTVTELYTALVRTLLLRYLDEHSKGPWLDVSEQEISSTDMNCFFKNLPSNVYQQLCTISRLAYQGLRNNQQLIFSDLPANFETLGLLQRVCQLHSDRETSVSYNFLHLTVQEFLAAFHILLQGPEEQQLHMGGEISFGHPSGVRREEWDGDESDEEESAENELDEEESDGDESNEEELAENELDEEESDEDESHEDQLDENEWDVRKGKGSDEVVCKFLAGLGGWMGITIPSVIRDKELNLLNLLFESQNVSLASGPLGNEDSVKNVILMQSIDPHDMYVLGYCISVSKCQWKLELENLSDEHLEMMCRGFTSWGNGKGRIIELSFPCGSLTNNGVCHLFSLPQQSLRGLTTLDLMHNKLDSRSCDMLSRHFSFLPHLKMFRLSDNLIGAGDNMPLIRAIPTAKSLQSVWFSSLSPEECWLLMSQGYVSKVSLLGLLDDSVEAMAAALNNHHSLVELTVWNSQFSPQNMSTFSSSLATNNTLEKLDLSWNIMDCECAQLLSQALHTNSTLKELELLVYTNDFVPVGCCSMAEALRVNKNLTVLNMHSFPLNKEGIRQLIDSLQHNHSLNTLQLPFWWKDFAEHLDGYHEMKSRIVFG